MLGALSMRRQTHDSRRSELATAFYDVREAAVQNHPFVAYRIKRQGFPTPRLRNHAFRDKGVVPHALRK